MASSASSSDTTPEPSAAPASPEAASAASEVRDAPEAPEAPSAAPPVEPEAELPADSVVDRADAPDSQAAAPPRALALSAFIARWMRADSRARRLVVATAVYVVCAGVFALFAGPDRLTEHTPYNHFALLADAWLHGRQDIAHGPPPYSMNNDFVSFEGKTYISFPPFPALLTLPFVKLASSPENFRDGQFFIWLAGIAPAVLFLVLEKLRRTGRSPRSERQNAVLALLFAFGSVYFFTSVEGTVWFAALVVGAALSAIYLLWAIDAERPLLAGAVLGCAYLTRPSVLLLGVFFALEGLRVSIEGGLPLEDGKDRVLARARAILGRLDLRGLLRRYALFAVPILAAFAITAWMNWTRYGRATPFFFDHELLSVAWRSRMTKWGLLGYHYFGKNLGIALTSLPWLPPREGAAQFGSPFKVNEHGLALWFTTPLYLWLLWPKRLEADPPRRWLYFTLAAAAALPVLMDLAYQNSGWRQFGYRFSNDYAAVLFVLLAVGGRPMRWLFGAAAVFAVACNAFGAATFDKAGFDKYYFRDGTQTIVYQPD